MKSKKTSGILVVLAFLAGAALPAILIWNPGHWKWAEETMVRMHNHPSETDETDRAQLWTCGMHPQVIQDKPGTCPICGMNLVPVYEEEEPEATGIHVDPNFIQNFAVRTAEVEKGSIPIVIRTIGTLDYNQKNIVSINTKFEGWIEKANVNYVGESVRRGEAVFEIYSPQLVTTQQEYLAAVDYLLSNWPQPNHDGDFGGLPYYVEVLS